ncbi:MAG: hypothetical protein WC515_04170 [Candidatus Omnitrophota bacterium]
MKKILLGLFISLIVISLLLAITNRPAKAQNEGSSPEVLKKLDEVLRAQKEVLDGIKSLREEVQIVKIRVTQQQ